MRKQAVIIIIVSIFIGSWIGYYLLHTTPLSLNSKSLFVRFDTTQFVDRKKELMLKEYDSVFTVVNRETTIIYSLRGWTVTLLALWLSVFLFKKSSNIKFMYLSGLFIILIFYVLEISERTIILSLVQELRTLESIFNLKTTIQFNVAVINYEFRDMTDQKKSLFSKNLFKAIGDPKTFCWSMFLYVLYFFAITKSRINTKRSS